MRKQHFTPREHLVVGARLSRIRDEVMGLRLAIEDAYGKRVGAKAAAIDRQLVSLKSEMDEMLCRENPLPRLEIEGVPITRVYYGWQGPAQRTACRTCESEREELRQAAETITKDIPWTTAQSASLKLSLAIAQLKASVQLRTLIAETLPLRRAGRDWVACCPFHAERTPSFHVYPDHFHCFGCSAHGDAFDWLGRTRGMRLAESVDYLQGGWSRASGVTA